MGGIRTGSQATGEEKLAINGRHTDCHLPLRHHVHESLPHNSDNPRHETDALRPLDAGVESRRFDIVGVLHQNHLMPRRTPNNGWGNALQSQCTLPLHTTSASVLHAPVDLPVFSCLALWASA